MGSAFRIDGPSLAAFGIFEVHHAESKHSLRFTAWQQHNHEINRASSQAETAPLQRHFHRLLLAVLKNCVLPDNAPDQEGFNQTMNGGNRSKTRHSEDGYANNCLGGVQYPIGEDRLEKAEIRQRLKFPWSGPGPCVGRGWSQRGESNPGPADYESAALPAELRWLTQDANLYTSRVRWSRKTANVFSPGGAPADFPIWGSCAAVPWLQSRP